VRLVFFGTPTYAVPYLQRVAQEHEVLAVVTPPDRPRGRGRKLLPGPVKQKAERLGLEVLQPESLRQADLSEYGSLQAAAALVVVAYGQILPAALCDAPGRPAINVHYSLLPDLRGAAPVPRAVWGGRQKTGVTIQYVAEELDSGDIILQQEVEIEPTDDTGSLFAKLEQIGVPLLSEALRLLEKGTAPRRPQDDSQATYAPPLRPEDAVVNWDRPAPEIVNQVRAFSPHPGAYCHYEHHRLKLFAPALAEEPATGSLPGQIVAVRPEGFLVQTGEGMILIGEVQLSGKRRMAAADFVHGASIDEGTIIA